MPDHGATPQPQQLANNVPRNLGQVQGLLSSTNAASHPVNSVRQHAIRQLLAAVAHDHCREGPSAVTKQLWTPHRAIEQHEFYG